ncbi:hypothetical protein Tco_1260509 [Tanacetum coccineum]
MLVVAIQQFFVVVEAMGSLSYLTNLSHRNCIPPEVILRVSRHPAWSASEKAVSSKPESFGYQNCTMSGLLDVRYMSDPILLSNGDLVKPYPIGTLPTYCLTVPCILVVHCPNPYQELRTSISRSPAGPTYSDDHKVKKGHNCDPIIPDIQRGRYGVLNEFNTAYQAIFLEYRPLSLMTRSLTVDQLDTPYIISKIRRIVFELWRYVVPTGRVIATVSIKVPAGRYIVPAGYIISPDRVT